MCPRISIRGSVRPLVRPFVRRSVLPSAGPSTGPSVRWFVHNALFSNARIRVFSTSVGEGKARGGGGGWCQAGGGGGKGVTRGRTHLTFSVTKLVFSDTSSGGWLTKNGFALLSSDHLNFNTSYIADIDGWIDGPTIWWCGFCAGKQIKSTGHKFAKKVAKH